MVTYGYIWSPFPKASKVVCQFMPLLQTSSRHHRAQPAQRKRAGRKSVERSGIHSRFELWNSGYDSFVLMLYRFSFFLLASSGLHIALLCHIVTVRLQAFSIKSSFSPVWSQFLEPKKSYTEQLEPSREVAGSASTSHPRYARYAYTCVMWGTNPGYALGAAVLGARLKDWTGCFNGRWSYGCRGIDR